MQSPIILKHGVWGVLALGMTNAFAVTPAGTPPTFYCNANRPANADMVEALFDTKAVSASDRSNQPRWEYAAPSFPGIANGPDPLPAEITSWTYFTGLETASYGLGSAISLARVGFYPNQTGAVNNTMRYFRYRFNLDASVDASKFTIKFATLAADDAIKGTYINGKRVSPSGPANTNLGAGTTSDLQWKTGLNELSFAVLDTINSATSLTVGSATHSCAVDVALTANPVITISQTPTYAGKVYYAAPGTIVTITLTGQGVSTSYTVAADSSLNYSVVGSALPAGTYTVTASIPGDPTPDSKPLLVTNLPNVNLTELPDITIADTPIFTGVASDTPTDTVVTVTITGPGVSKTYSAQTDSAGNYSVSGELLPVGSYTVTASIPADTTPDTKSFKVTNTPNVLLTALPSFTINDTPSYGGTASNTSANTTVTITVAGNGVSETYTTPTDASGNYSIPGAKLPSGSYTVTASIPGDLTPDRKTFTVSDLPNVLLDTLPDITFKDVPTYAGSTTNAAAGTTVTIAVKGAGLSTSKAGVSESYSATTDASGNYSVAGAKLPADTYTVTASIPLDPTPDSKPFKVSGPVTTEPTPVPALGLLGPGILSGLVFMGAVFLRRKRIQ